MRKFWKNHKGVTMVEVLVTVAILAIVVAPCLSAFVMAQRGNVKAAEAQAAYTAAANLMESLKGVQIPEGSTWTEEINKQVTQVQNNKNDGISVYGAFKNTNAYYEIVIYAGELDGQPAADSGVEPLLKGVIAP